MARGEVADPLAARIGARVKALRQERGMTIPQLAKASGVSKGQISTIERGLVVMKVRTLTAIARGLGVMPAQIVTFPEEGALEAVAEMLFRMPEAERRRVVGRVKRG